MKTGSNSGLLLGPRSLKGPVKPECTCSDNGSSLPRFCWKHSYSMTRCAIYSTQNILLSPQIWSYPHFLLQAMMMSSCALAIHTYTRRLGTHARLSANLKTSQISVQLLGKHARVTLGYLKHQRFPPPSSASSPSPPHSHPHPYPHFRGGWTRGALDYDCPCCGWHHLVLNDGSHDPHHQSRMVQKRYCISSAIHYRCINTTQACTWPS